MLRLVACIIITSIAIDFAGPANVREIPIVCRKDETEKQNHPNSQGDQEKVRCKCCFTVLWNIVRTSILTPRQTLAMKGDLKKMKRVVLPDKGDRVLSA